MIQICTLKTPKNQACSSDHRVIFAGSQVVRFPWETLLEFGLIIRRYAATWAWVFVNGYLFPPKYWEIVCSWQKRKLEYWKQLWLSLIVAERESRVLEYDGKWREIHSHLVLLWFKIRGTFPRRSWSSDIVKFWHDAPITYFDFFVSLFVKTIFPQYCLQKVYFADKTRYLVDQALIQFLKTFQTDSKSVSFVCLHCVTIEHRHHYLQNTSIILVLFS